MDVCDVCLNEIKIKKLWRVLVRGNAEERTINSYIVYPRNKGFYPV